MSDRTGGFVGNGDKIMALLGKDPTKTWQRATLGKALKLSDDQLEAAVAQLGKWIKQDTTTKSVLLSDRAGGFIGNGYWGGDRARFEAACQAVAGISTNG